MFVKTTIFWKLAKYLSQERIRPCIQTVSCLFVRFWRDSSQWARASSFTRFLDHTQRCTIVGRTPVDEWSARRRDLSLTSHNTHNRQTSMPAVGFEPTFSAGERPQTYALDRAATGTGTALCYAGEIFRCRFRTASCFDQRSKSYCQWLVNVDL
jgi:hypothetical protein